MRIVLVEDNVGLCRGIENFLRDHGYAVDSIYTGDAADEFLKSQGADLAIIDIVVPVLDGFEIIRRVRHRGDTMPILILTARGDTKDRVFGLEIGADDYLVKPFEMAELYARIRALARRRQPLVPTIEKIGLLKYDHGTRCLFGPDGPIELKRRERALFESLSENLGRIVSKENLIEQLYGTGADIGTNAIELSVSRLRRNLLGSGLSIRTVRGLGYVMSTD